MAQGKRLRDRFRRRKKPAPPPPPPPLEPEAEPETEDSLGGDLGGYARKSPPANPALTLSQEDEIRESEHGEQIGEFFVDDGVSGDVHWTRRPGLSRLIYAIQDGRLRGIVFRDLERLARSMNEQENILHAIWTAGGRVISLREGELLPDVPGSIERQRTRKALAYLNEMELDAIRERRERGFRRAQAAGRYLGGRPYQRKYGYQMVKRWDPSRKAEKRGWEAIPEEMETVWEIKSHAERRDWQAVADDLNRRGVPTVTGVPWIRCTIRAIALRPEQAPRDGAVVRALPKYKRAPAEQKPTGARSTTSRRSA